MAHLSPRVSRGRPSADLTADRAAVPPQHSGNRGGRQPALPEQPEGVSFREADLAVQHAWASFLLAEIEADGIGGSRFSLGTVLHLLDEMNARILRYPHSMTGQCGFFIRMASMALCPLVMWESRLSVDNLVT